jgi:putative phosphoesterase
MKILAASDIHGSSYYCRKLLERLDAEGADRMLLLGDLLYHGPRNELPQEYETKSVTAQLNARKDRIFAVRGNCDAEIDQVVLEFPIMAEYCILSVGTRLIYATHGHIFGEDHPPKLHKGDILLHGHTHVPKCVDHGDFIYMNPGSVSLPKEGSWHGYLLIEDTGCIWKDLDGTVKMEYRF